VFFDKVKGDQKSSSIGPSQVKGGMGKKSVLAMMAYRPVISGQAVKVKYGQLIIINI